ncbi:hypothetical protein Tco_1005591 [Tanacetum coccineum]|uniref:Uncharacterized protein n=1 Tax=Tanacetum coccineum TaxID=301880 RepID=A0ABQ5FGJ5_9ASTR
MGAKGLLSLRSITVANNSVTMYQLYNKTACDQIEVICIFLDRVSPACYLPFLVTECLKADQSRLLVVGYEMQP